MKRNLLNSILFVSISLFLMSCIATHYGNMSDSAALGSPNFRYKRQNVVGVSQATYVLGIGGVARQSLILEAKKAMLRENPLLDNQALANVSVSYKTTGFLGFVVTTVICTVSADIVEFGPAKTDVSESQSQNSKNTLPQDNSATVDNETAIKKPLLDDDRQIMVGDNVKIINYFSKPVEGKVIEIKNGEYIVEYKRPNNKIKKARVLGFQVEKIR